MALRTFGLVGVVSVTLAACGQAEEPTTAPAPVPVESPAATPAQPAGPGLTGEGLSLGATTAVFGAPVADVVAAVSAVMGGEPVGSANPACPTGGTEDFAWGGRLTIVSREGDFIGWRSTEPGPASASGLRAGDTRARAETGSGFSVIEAPFDRTLFTVDGVFGFLSRDGQTVDTLYAGDVCLAS